MSRKCQKEKRPRAFFAQNVNSTIQALVQKTRLVYNLEREVNKFLLSIASSSNEHISQMEYKDLLRVSDFIGSTLFIEIDDDRSLQGILVAVDCQMNLLLDHVHEHTKSIGSRTLGLVSVPQYTIKNIKISQAKFNALVDFKKELQRNIV